MIGANRVVIRLNPAGLGHVQVRIDRAADGTSHVVLAVERSDTLMLLLQDRPHLNRALDAAGIPAEGRTMQFSLGDPSRLAPPNPAPAPAPALLEQGSGPGSSNQGSSNQGSSLDMGGGAGANGGSPNSERGRNPAPQGSAEHPNRRPGRHAIWQRAGVDITA